MLKAKTVSGFLAAAWCVAALSTPTVAQAQDQWALGTSSVGSGPYRWGAAISEIVNMHQSGIVLHAQGTAGFNENLFLVNDGTVQLALSDATSAASAYKGLAPFDKVEGGLKNLRWVAGAIIGVGHCFARADSGITEIAGIRGKPWNLNVKSTSTRTINETLLAAAGVDVKEIRPFELATGEVFDAMKDRIIAGSCNILGMNASQLQSLAATTEFRLLPVDGELYEKFGAGMFQGVIPLTIPAGTYPGQAEAVKTFGVVTPILASASVSDDLIYEFTKAFWDNLAALQEKERPFRALKFNKEMAYGGGVVPVHEGAARYYKEKFGAN